MKNRRSEKYYTMEVSAGEDFQQNVIGIAEYDYSAKEDDEIDLRKGQELKNIIQKPGGWWEGTISETGKRGIFPDNFVRVFENSGNNIVVLREKSSTVQRRCKAIYSYTQVNEDELTLSVGDIIDFLTEVEEGWWKGRLNNKVGVFPSNFVVVLPTPPNDVSQRLNLNEDTNVLKSKTKKVSNINNRNQTCSDKNAIRSKIIDTTLNKSIDNYKGPELPPRPTKEYCRVEFPYSPQNEDELDLIIGQIITIVDKELPDKGWWKGEVNGKIGVFPDNFVKLLSTNVTIEKDIEASQSITVAEETGNTKKKSSTISPPKGLETKSLHEKLQTENIERPQGLSLEELSNKNLISASTSNRTNENCGLKKEGAKKKKDNFDEKKTPPPLPNKKPAITVKANATGTALSSSRQKVKTVEQEPTLSQDANNDSHSRKSNNETISNNERTVSFDEIVGFNNEFDKIQRTSLLPDMRAGRVKAPKRRPPSVTPNLMPENIISSEILTKENEEVFIEWESEKAAQFNTEQPKPKNVDWGAQKLPWMDELKASQIKIKLLPLIEPRTTLVSVNNDTTDNKNSSTPPTHVSSKAINADDKSSSLCSQPSIDQNIISKADINEQGSAIRTNNEILRDHFKEFEQTPKSLHSKINVMQKVLEQTKSSSSYVEIERNVSPVYATQEETITELGKRVQRLEANVQVQQKLIEDLIRMLQNESNRVELLKNQLDKYAQCVTQV